MSRNFRSSVNIALKFGMWEWVVSASSNCVHTKHLLSSGARWRCPWRIHGNDKYFSPGCLGTASLLNALEVLDASASCECARQMDSWSTFPVSSLFRQERSCTLWHNDTYRCLNDGIHASSICKAHTWTRNISLGQTSIVSLANRAPIGESMKRFSPVFQKKCIIYKKYVDVAWNQKWCLWDQNYGDVNKDFLECVDLCCGLSTRISTTRALWRFIWSHRLFFIAIIKRLSVSSSTCWVQIF